MTLDGVEWRFHVRERDNRIAILISQPGWAAASCRDYYYVSIEDLGSNGWKHREGSTEQRGGMSWGKAIQLAREWYVREAHAGRARPIATALECEVRELPLLRDLRDLVKAKLDSGEIACGGKVEDAIRALERLVPGSVTVIE
jgi:hypothetical protein